MIEAEPPHCGCVAGHEKNTVQRIFRHKIWKVRKRPLGQRLRIEAKVSRAEGPDHHWATDLCRVLRGKDGWPRLIDGIL